MKKHTLKPAQINAIKLLSMGTPAHQVAARLEITTMTLYRWQKIPEFETVLRSTAYSGLEEIAKKMNATTLTAIETLQEILCDLREPSAVRMKAAMVVLSTVAPINSMLEKSLKHRTADFDLQDRFAQQGWTYDACGNSCPAFKK